MAMNKTNGYILDDYTAKELMLLAVEGVQVWATPAQWRRINKRAAKLGMYVPNTDVVLGVEVAEQVNTVIYGCDLMDEVDAFLEDMYIMGMLDEEDED